MKNIVLFVLVVGVIAAIGFGIFAISKKSKNGPAGNNSADIKNSSIAEELKVKEGDQIRGNKEAKITIVNYSDYQCPYCVIYDRTLKEIIEAYPTEVKWVYRHFPLPFHQAAKGAAIAVEAAGEQGKYWEYNDLLVENSQADGKGLLEADLLKYATDLKLDIEKFKTDLASSEIVDKVEADTKSADKLKITGTPASYLVDQDGNVEVLKGALTASQLKTKIDKLIKK